MKFRILKYIPLLLGLVIVRAMAFGLDFEAGAEFSDSGDYSSFSIAEWGRQYPTPTLLVQAQVQGASSLTNASAASNSPPYEVYLIETNTQPTIWERYRRTTSVHPLRRADVLFFISIPFTILWTDFWVQRFRDFSAMGAYFEGVRGTENLRNSNFSYDHDLYPSSVTDPFYLFKWVNAVLWPLVILTNDFMERISDPVEWEKEKEEMIDNRFHLNLIYFPHH